MSLAHTESTNNSPVGILLSFVGFHDPFFQGAADIEQHEGPVLSLLRGQHFDVAVVISTPNTKERTEEAIEAIENRFPRVSAVSKHIELTDPSDYFEILPGLRSVLQSVRDEYPKGQFFVGTASGTPQMHASWVMLTASGEFPARLLQVRPPRFVTDDKPSIAEIDPSNAEFPTIRQNIWRQHKTDAADTVDTLAIIKQLNIVGDHPLLKQAIEQACLVADSNEPILILGESGTGKELIAKLVHLASNRADKPFIAINCSAIPEELAESTLFGHKKGGFTGATGERIGKFKEADQGTIFLDELGELPLPIQAKLLRTIEHGEIEPVGGKTEKVDVRIVAATNRKLSADYQENDFRQDLYFRLSVGEVRMPPLRDRRSDIAKIAMSLLDTFCQSLKRRKSFSPEAIVKLESYGWPGNVRELSNVIKRAVLISIEAEIKPEQIDVNLQSEDASLTHLPTPQEGFELNAFVDKVRSELYSKAMSLAGGNQKGAAALLGLTPAAVSKFLKQKTQNQLKLIEINPS